MFALVCRSREINEGGAGEGVIPNLSWEEVGSIGWREMGWARDGNEGRVRDQTSQCLLISSSRRQVRISKFLQNEVLRGCELSTKWSRLSRFDGQWSTKIEGDRIHILGFYRRAHLVQVNATVSDPDVWYKDTFVVDLADSNRS